MDSKARTKSRGVRGLALGLEAKGRISLLRSRAKSYVRFRTRAPLHRYSFVSQLANPGFLREVRAFPVRIGEHSNPTVLKFLATEENLMY